ncbi:NAD(P)-dependent alcohol dehydrogenase [Candidatus Neomarinimicrobiota bacterium]
MKAIVCTKYGPPEVLQLQEVEKPAPRKNEVCIKIFATTVTASDCITRGFNVPTRLKLPMGLVVGFTKPRQPILGMVLAGEVESVGKNVKRFEKGNKVFGFTIKNAFQMRFGTYAEYMCLPENWMVAFMPSDMTFEEAAAIPYGGLISMHFLKKAKIQTRRQVLIYGASGANGTSAVQLAKYFGAEVTGICSTANLEMVKSLGADRVIDYTKEDVTSGGNFYDFIFDAVGKRKSSHVPFKKILAPKGKFLSVDDGSPKPSINDLHLLKKLSETKQLKPVIDRTYPMEQIVEAHRYVDQGHKKGNVVITVEHRS